MNTYTPISCSLYDELELRAMRGKMVDIVLTDGQQLSDQIETLETRKNDGEYLILKSGKEFRLDKLKSVDNLPFNGSSC